MHSEQDKEPFHAQGVSANTETDADKHVNHAWFIKRFYY